MEPEEWRDRLTATNAPSTPAARSVAKIVLLWKPAGLAKVENNGPAGDASKITLACKALPLLKRLTASAPALRPTLPPL